MLPRRRPESQPLRSPTLDPHRSQSGRKMQCRRVKSPRPRRDRCLTQVELGILPHPRLPQTSPPRGVFPPPPVVDAPLPSRRLCQSSTLAVRCLSFPRQASRHIIGMVVAVETLPSSPKKIDCLRRPRVHQPRRHQDPTLRTPHRRRTLHQTWSLTLTLTLTHLLASTPPLSPYSPDSPLLSPLPVSPSPKNDLKRLNSLRPRLQPQTPPPLPLPPPPPPSPPQLRVSLRSPPTKSI